MRLSVFRTAIVVVCSLLVAPLFAATYIVPPDREIIQRAEHIVLATAISSHGELTREGGVVTVTELRIEESLKGGLAIGDTLRVADPGGEVGSSRVVVFGAPRYRDGQRYLVFTEEWPDGRSRTYAIGLGKFDVVQDRSGRWLAMHGADSDVVGFDANSLDPYVERARDLSRFTEYVRGIVAQKIAPDPQYYVDEAVALVAPATDDASVTAFAFTQASYLGLAGQLYRWTSPTVAWKLFGSQPSLNGATAASTGAGAWTNDPASNVNYTISATVPASAGGGLTTADGQNIIAFNDPNNELGSFAGGLGGISAATPTKSPLPDGSGQAFSPTEVDIVVSKSFSPVAQNCLNTVITHEMGHTLGFRHSNKTGDDSAACAAPAECSSSAVMTSTTQCSFNGVLQPWDKDAVQTVYGSGPVCTPPSISNVSGTATITAGQSTLLSVTATGTATLSYQWYTGTSGNTASPVQGGTSASISVSPTSTTSYWVRVTGQCAPVADSATVTVTVNAAQCVAPNITGNPQSIAITSGANGTLTVTATGTALTYQWYIGTASSTTSPTGTNSSSLVVNPTSTTSYWVRVTNACGSKDSTTATVTVNQAQCIPPQIITQPQDQTVVSGNTATLSVGHNSSNPTVVWYQGAPPNTSSPVGSGRVVTTGPITQTTTFYATLTNACGNVTTRTMTVTVSATCTPPAITSVTATPATISFGLATNLTVVATGTSLSYQWFVGASGDTSSPLNGATSESVNVTASATTSYWVRVSSGCGAPAVNSPAVVVTVVACVAPTALTINAPAHVPPGTTATLMAVVTGSEPLKYQWFEGGNGDTSKPVGTDNAGFITPPLTTPKIYWVRVTNACGGADALNVLIDLKANKRRAASH